MVGCWMVLCSAPVVEGWLLTRLCARRVAPKLRSNAAHPHRRPVRCTSPSRRPPNPRRCPSPQRLPPPLLRMVGRSAGGRGRAPVHHPTPSVRACGGPAAASPPPACVRSKRTSLLAGTVTAQDIRHAAAAAVVDDGAPHTLRRRHRHKDVRVVERGTTEASGLPPSAPGRLHPSLHLATTPAASLHNR